MFDHVVLLVPGLGPGPRPGPRARGPAFGPRALGPGGWSGGVGVEFFITHEMQMICAPLRKLVQQGLHSSRVLAWDSPVDRIGCEGAIASRLEH